jgi:hypothetical protein
LNVYWHSQDPKLGFEFSFTTATLSMLFMSIFFITSWMFLLKTNNPITRYNPFSLNPKWTGKMEHSMDESPGQMFDLDSPDINEVKRTRREKKINEILK